MTENRLNLKKPEVLDRLTKFEKARVIGTRASQIQHQMPTIYIKTEKDSKKVILMPPELDKLCKTSEESAKMELNTKSTPLIVKRLMPDGSAILRTIQEL